MRVRQVTVKGFKSIVDQTVALGRVNCFIGANGAGKSNVLEALGVLGAAAAARVDDESLLRRGVRAGLPRLFKSSFPDSSMPPHIALEASGEPDATYRVSLLNPLEKPEPAWLFETEFLASGSQEILTRDIRDKRNLDKSSGLAALKVVELRAADPASLLLKALQGYAIYTPNTPALRGTAADPQNRTPVGLAGGSLAEGFESLKHGLDEERLDEVLGLIDWVSDAGATESAGALLSPAVPRGKPVLTFTDRFMAPPRNTLTAYDGSEGALYVLFAAVLCLSRSAPSVFAIDNLDSALHPRLLTRLVERLADWLKFGDSNRQLLFTAHNPAALDGLDLDDDEIRLFAVERNSAGHTTVRRISLSPELQALSKEYPLSRLWAMGNLGAVANAGPSSCSGLQRAG